MVHTRAKIRFPLTIVAGIGGDRDVVPIILIRGKIFDRFTHTIFKPFFDFFRTYILFYCKCRVSHEVSTLCVSVSIWCQYNFYILENPNVKFRS